MIKKIFIGLGALLAVLLALILALPLIAPSQLVRDQIVAAVKKQTGRTLVIGGDASFAFIPNIGIKLTDVSLSNPPQMADGTLIKMNSFVVDLKLWPMINGKVEVSRFILNQPVITLVSDRKGRKNWDFAWQYRPAVQPVALVTEAERSDLVRPALLVPDQSADQADLYQVSRDGQNDQQNFFGPDKLTLGEVRIVDGRLLFRDAKAGTVQQADHIYLTLRQPTPDAALKAVGSLVWQKGKIGLDAVLPPLGHLAANRGGDITARITVPHGVTNFKGRLTAGQAELVKGHLVINSPDLKGLLSWVQNGQSAGLPGFALFNIKTDVSVKPKRVALSGMNIRLDDMTFTGKTDIVLSGAKPDIIARIQAPKLDVMRFMPPPASGRKKAAVEPVWQSEPVMRTGSVSGLAIVKTNALSGARPDPIGAMISSLDVQDKQRARQQMDRHRRERLAQRRVPAGVSREWDRTPFNFAGLHAVNADIDLTLGQIVYERIKIGQTVVKLKLTDALAVVNLVRTQLYDGTGKGVIRLNARRAIPALAVQFDLKGVNALPLLKDAAQFDWVSGALSASIFVDGSGMSQAELIASLNGKGTMQFADGAIEGVNIPAMIRNFNIADLGRKMARDSSQKTDFTSLSGRFSIKRGIINFPRGNGLVLLSPLMRARAEGQVDMPRRYLSMHVRPKLVGSLQGQGGSTQLNGVEIPITIKGPWSNPRPKLDVARLFGSTSGNNIRSADDLRKALKGLGLQKGKKIRINRDNLGQLIGGLLGNKGQKAPPPASQNAPAAQQAPPPQQRRNNTEELIGNVFDLLQKK